MRSLLDRLGRRPPAPGSDEGFAALEEWGDWVWPAGWRSAMAEGDPRLIARSWNSVGTLAVGPIADVDGSGAVALRQWPVTVDTWFRVGDRWINPSREPSLQQRRVDGLPVIETRVRSGPADVVLTAFADESGGSRGRVIIGVENRAAVPIAVATVVRPFTALGRGRARSIRVVDRRVVVEGTPLIELPTDALDAAVGNSEAGDVWHRLSDTLVGADSVSTEDGSGTLAAVWPLAAGASATVAVADGLHPVESGPTPVDQVVAGWKAHLDRAASISLPGWPDHLVPALVSGMLLRVEEPGPPLGATASDRGDDAMVAAALAGYGLFDAAAIELERLIDGMTDGSVPRSRWAYVGAALARGGVGLDAAVWRRRGAPTAAALGALAEMPVNQSTRRLIAVALDRTAGSRAVGDAARIAPAPASPDAIARLVDLGVELEEDHDPPRDLDVGSVIRAAGTTWRWERDGAGDSPHERALIAIRIRRAACRESDRGLDVAPGFSGDWLGRPVDVDGLPTAWGRLSYSIRWHGARPALLWEIDPPAGGNPPDVTGSVLDPTFRTSELSGEALLAAPEVER